MVSGGLGMAAKLTAELCLVELPVELREQRRGCEKPMVVWIVD
jgi:hypothetical protein